MNEDDKDSDGNYLGDVNKDGLITDIDIALAVSQNIDFLDKEGNEMKSEYLIPTVVNNLIRSGEKQVHVLRTSSKWFGVTYKEDKPFVSQQIQELIDYDIYPKQLF